MRFQNSLLAALILFLAMPATALGDRDESGNVTVEGIFVRAEADAWTGTPANLREVIPIRVMIENRSSTPLRIRLQEFSLVGEDGEQFVALPPFQIEGEVSETVTPAYPYDGFFVAPHLRGYYPGLAWYDHPFAYDPFYYGTFGPRLVEYKLPTMDMLQKALPEGVLQPGGQIMGFIYFDERAEKAADQYKGDLLDFRTELVSAHNGQSFGQVRIPLEID